MNTQLDPASPQHLRQDSMVKAWIANYQRDNWSKHEDCRRCGWPHSPVTICGMGSVFGRVRLGGKYAYVDSSNVEHLRQFVETLSTLGFHWRDEVFIARVEGRVVISHIEYFNNNPSVKQWTIPVNEFASIVCAASEQGETSERYQQALAFLQTSQPLPADPPAPQPVIQHWACLLPLRMQSTMLLSLRGPDGCAKLNPAKMLLRQLRSAVLVAAFPGVPDSFMGDQRGYEDWRVAEVFLDEHDEYPHHWLMHFIHAAEIVGQFHPHDTIRAFWWRFYIAACGTFHMQNENIDALSRRLADPEPLAPLPAAPGRPPGDAK